MKKIACILIFICSFFHFAHAQSFLKRTFPTAAVQLQYAGSIGLLSAGYFRLTPNKKLELGLIYGNVPQAFGGPLHSITLKVIYNPFRLKLSPKFTFDPIQASFFMTDWSGETLHTSWSGRYPKGYYWWQSSLRKSLAMSTQISYNWDQKKAERISLYLEANTNDLYLYNYVPNTESQSFYDIIYYGVGCKLYFN